MDKTNQMFKRKLVVFFVTSAALVTLMIIALGLWAYSLDLQIRNRLEKGWFQAPTEFFSAAAQFRQGQTFAPKTLRDLFLQRGYRQRHADQPLWAKDFKTLDAETCQSQMDVDIPLSTQTCFLYKLEKNSLSSSQKSNPKSATALVTLDENNVILQTYSGEPLAATQSVHLQPELLAQYYGNKPVRQTVIELGQAPLSCLQAITAIEDEKFLDHLGVSPTGLLRAVSKNLLKGRYAQGGSTITQQLVKNYFLTSEKTIKRKITEIVMAVILEGRFSKDEILQTYLNVIYMGQNGPFAVHGFAAASGYYFRKPLHQLELSECALLAAVVNSPGRYNPFTHSDRATSRRKLVLSKMRELNWISEASQKQAELAPLPKDVSRSLREPAPYFIQAVRKQLKQLNIDNQDGLRVFTTVNWANQKRAQLALYKELEALDKRVKKAKPENEGKSLQATLISVDLHSNSVTTLIGGRSYRKSQYNRAIEAHRQVGSIMKPIVYLAALESLTSEGHPYTPLTSLSDERFSHKYEGQEWSPENYAKKYRGTVPLFYALKESLNVPTARLGLDIGLNSIIDVGKRLGVSSSIQPLPALTLGAFELYPLEVAQVYSSIARMGDHLPLQIMTHVEDLAGNVIWQNERAHEQVVSEDTAAVLVGMLKNTVATGTARSLSTWRGITHPAAGKTGTTSDTKDAWFAGFTPHILTIVWVGYDDNTSHGLTGSSGAVPIWANYMKEVLSEYAKDDFPWPENSVRQYFLRGQDLTDLLNQPQEKDKEGASLVFRAGNEP